MNPMSDLVIPVCQFIWTTAKLLAFTAIDSAKALLPIGVLPRKSIKGDIALITGSGSGLGRMMAVEFAKHGADLVLWDINTAGNEETRAMLEGSGVRVWTYTVDLSKRADIAAKAEIVKEEVGRVDILVHNAGVVFGKRLLDTTEEEIITTMSVNCLAAIFLTKHFLPGMVDRQHGHILTIASIAGKLGVSGLVDYCTSKHGVVGFHDSLTDELRVMGARGVKTSLICPYYIRTGMFDGVTTHSPRLLPLLDSDYVIKSIMETMLTEKVEMYIPRFLYITTSTRAFFPSRVNSLMFGYFKIAETMAGFRGRRPVEARQE